MLGADLMTITRLHIKMVAMWRIFHQRDEDFSSNTSQHNMMTNSPFIKFIADTLCFSLHSFLFYCLLTASIKTADKTLWLMLVQSLSLGTKRWFIHSERKENIFTLKERKSTYWRVYISCILLTSKCPLWGLRKQSFLLQRTKESSKISPDEKSGLNT